MTQTVFADKYDLPLAFVSSLISQNGVEPIGRVQGKTKVAKDYNEKTLVELVLGEYQRRYQADAAKAKEWREKAAQIKSTYRKGLDHGNAEVLQGDC